ncbi:MAG: hypothetical protein ACI9QL_003933 [Candidatus Omnitrophota bacterium]|jgi:hypothetical protein
MVGQREWPVPVLSYESTITHLFKSENTTAQWTLDYSLTPLSSQIRDVSRLLNSGMEIGPRIGAKQNLVP